MNNIPQISEHELTNIAYFEETQQYFSINYAMQIQFSTQN